MALRVHAAAERGLMRIAVAILAAALLGAAAAARAQDERPTVVITDPNARSFRAAVQEFAPGGAGLDTAGFRSQLADALDFSGVFTSLDPAAFLAPRRTASLGGTLACADWTPIGADAVVEGVTSGGPTLAIDFRVWDVARCTALLHKRYTGGARDAGRIAKRIADDVVEAFTGKRGVASTEIAYVSTRGQSSGSSDGAPEIWVMDADGANARQATRNRSINGFPAWSPDGRAIVYMSYLFERSPHLFRLVRGGGLKAGRMLEGLDSRTPVYRGVYDPSGQHLAVVVSMDGAPEIYVVDADGRNPRRLTRHKAIDVSPTWSPDGRRIAFVSDRTGAPNLYVMDADGGNLRRITFGGGYHTAPAWSPDGRWIAYELRAGGGQFDIWLADPEGEGQAPLVTHPRSDENPTWAPDSRKLAFHSTRTGRPEIHVVDIDGENVRQITRGGGESTAPHWGPYPR